MSQSHPFRCSVCCNRPPLLPEMQAAMMLISIEPARARDVNLHTFRCAVCDQVLETFATYEDSRERLGQVSCALHTGYFPSKLNSPQRQHLTRDSLRAPGTNPERADFSSSGL